MAASRRVKKCFVFLKSHLKFLKAQNITLSINQRTVLIKCYSYINKSKSNKVENEESLKQVSYFQCYQTYAFCFVLTIVGVAN